MLLADEISRGLDAGSLVELATLIKDLKDEAGLSVVVVSHENRFTAALAERIYLIVDGYLMPTPMMPAPQTGSDEAAFLPQDGLLNPVYDVYCRGSGGAATGQATEPEPDRMPARLDGEILPGCVVHQLLGGTPGENTAGNLGCRNHGAERCLDLVANRAKVCSVCC